MSCEILTPDVCLSSCIQSSLSPPSSFFFGLFHFLDSLTSHSTFTPYCSFMYPTPLETFARSLSPSCTDPVCAGGDGRSRGGARHAQGESSPPVGGTSSRQGLRPPRVPAVSAVPCAQQPNQGNPAPSFCSPATPPPSLPPPSPCAFHRVSGSRAFRVCDHVAGNVVDVQECRKVTKSVNHL